MSDKNGASNNNSDKKNGKSTNGKKAQGKKTDNNNGKADGKNGKADTRKGTAEEGESLLSQVIHISIIVVLTAILISLWNTYQEQLEKRRQCLNPDHYETTARNASKEDANGRPVVWLYGDADVPKWLDLVTVFNDMGYICGGPGNEWDVLWTHHAPFAKPLDLKNVVNSMEGHQKVNHFPGTKCITEEVLDSSISKYIPSTFVMPRQKADFLKESKKPNKVWIEQKNGASMVKDVNDLDLSTEGTVIQEYIANPYLIGNRKFDITVYVQLTSVDPLRVYLLDTDWALRVAPQEYNPIDYSKPEQYITDSYVTPITAIPELKKLHIDMKHNTKQSVYAQLKFFDNKDPDTIDGQIMEAVRDVFVAKRDELRKALQGYIRPNLFFELFKFDFALDENLKVHLLKADTLPSDIVSELADKNEEHKEIYKQALYAGLSLTGVAGVVPNSRNHSAEDVLAMKVRDCDIQAATDRCHLPICETCGKQECVLCYQCTTEDERFMMKEAYLEHVNRHLTRRIYPERMTQEEAKNYDYHKDDHLAPRDRLIREWFRGKCVEEAYWCS
ncbi:probable tubulin polyglutamylase ttll-15 [Amphiura filiformis]|uniref:probable tubulin polyglutamylase ttll-15 n=1 Tax=Amphiura filiformis TaxID=82378 RepID=UPI003B20E44F